MPEVERPEFRKDAKPTERSYGKNVVRGKGCAFEKVVGIERLGVTGGASKASDKCSFAKISGNNKDWCNGRGEQGKDALACVPKGFARTQSQPSIHSPSPWGRGLWLGFENKLFS